MKKSNDASTPEVQKWMHENVNESFRS